MTYNLPRNIDVILSIHNLKQPEFGKMIGNSSGAAVSSWVKGRVKPPIDKVVLISTTFNIDLDTLVFGQVGKGNEQYDTFVKENHPELLKEERENYEVDNVDLSSGLFKKPNKLGALVRFLSKNHDELKKDELYQLYVAKIVQENKNEEKREELRNTVLKKKQGL